MPTSPENSTKVFQVIRRRKSFYQHQPNTAEIMKKEIPLAGFSESTKKLWKAEKTLQEPSALDRLVKPAVSSAVVKRSRREADVQDAIVMSGALNEPTEISNRRVLTASSPSKNQVQDLFYRWISQPKKSLCRSSKPPDLKISPPSNFIRLGSFDIQHRAIPDRTSRVCRISQPEHICKALSSHPIVNTILPSHEEVTSPGILGTCSKGDKLSVSELTVHGEINSDGDWKRQAECHFARVQYLEGVINSSPEVRSNFKISEQRSRLHTAIRQRSIATVRAANDRIKVETLEADLLATKNSNLELQRQLEFFKAEALGQRVEAGSQRKRADAAEYMCVEIEKQQSHDMEVLQRAFETERAALKYKIQGLQSQWLPAAPVTQAGLKIMQNCNLDPLEGHLFRFGSRRVQRASGIHRIGFSPVDKEDKLTMKDGGEAGYLDLTMRLGIWEWNSVPDLELLDPRTVEREY